MAAFRSSPPDAARTPPWPQTVAICLVGLLSSGVAATCAAYYIAEPMAQRTPAITGDSLGSRAKAQRDSSPRTHTTDRPVRLAESDTWLDSLRNNSYWKQKSSGRNQTSRGNTQRQSRNEGETRNGRSPTVHKFSSAKHSFPAAGRTYTYYQHQSTTYRTVCVRLCDGFFWPVSFATTKSNLKRDSETCQKTCESPVALYHYTNLDGGPEDLVSLDGQPYTGLSGAFLYRTTYQPNCKCRPHPWEQEALERHMGYAKNAATGSAEPRSEE